MGKQSGAFDSYLRAARAVDAEPQTTAVTAAIAEYLDELQNDF
jgi:hypothetical protein